MKLHSGEIKLRTFKKTDIPRLVELANNVNIARNLRDGFPNPYTHEHAEAFIGKCIKLDPQTIFAIEYKAEYVGNIGLEKCGYIKEGVFKKAVYKQGKFWNEVRYAKIYE